MQRRSPGVQGLFFGGLMAALTVVFSLVPVLSAFMPIPLVLAFVRYGGRVAVLTATAATLFTMGAKGPVSGLLAIPAGILPGLVFGYGFRHKWRPLTIGIAAVVVFFLGFAMTYGVTRVAMFEGRDPFVAALETPLGREQIGLAVELADQMADRIEETVARSGVEPTPSQQQMIAQYRAVADRLSADPVGMMWTLLPASLFFAGCFSAWLNYLLCRLILPRFGHAVPTPVPFAEFRLPAWLVWLYAGLALVSPYFLKEDVVGMPWWAKLLLNVFTPLMLIFVLAGAAVAYGFLRKKGVSKGASALVVVIGSLMLGPLGLQLMMLLAMWDTIFDLRGLGHGLWKRPEESH